MEYYNPDLRETQEWLAADNLYSQNLKRYSYSIVGVAPLLKASWESIDRNLIEILNICPHYYPALFHRAQYMLRLGNSTDGEEFLDKAFNSLSNILLNEDEFSPVMTSWADVLEKLLKYDLAAKYMEAATRLFPDTAAFYDYLAFYLLQLPGADKSKALSAQLKALDLDPDNDYFINNLGWIYLMMQDFENAQEYFQKAVDYNFDNTPATENLETAQFMTENNLTYLEYLTRPADMTQIQELFDIGVFEDIKNLCRGYNSDRLDAFKILHLQKNSFPTHEILNILQSSEAFLKLIEESIDIDEFFLLENIELFLEKTKNFVGANFNDNDEVAEVLFPNIMLESLPIFYDFLRERNMISSDQFEQVKERFNILKSLTQIPPMHGTSWEGIDRGLQKIMEESPGFYYPVLFRWGEYMLSIGRDDKGAEIIKNTFNALFDILKNEEEDEDDFNGAVIQCAENLGKFLRYDLAAKFMEKATRLFPETADYYDALASNLIQLPGKDKHSILRIQEKALELEPDNDSFINHLGWIYLMMGNYEDAKKYFLEASDINSENTGAEDNLEIAEYMEENGETYVEYLLCSTDTEYIKKLYDMEEYEAISDLCRIYNNDRLKAFTIHTLEKCIFPPHEIYNITQQLESVLSVIYDSLNVDEYFLFDNPDILIGKSRYFIYQYLEEAAVVDENTLRFISHAITVFYDFLQEKRIITEALYKQIAEHINLLKEEFSGKIDEYNEICNDFSHDEDEKKEMIEKLFGI